MNWFRLYVEARNDAKLRSLTDAEHRVWFNLLCFAAEQEERGSVTGVTPRDTNKGGVTPGDDLIWLAVEVASGDTELLETTITKLIRLRILTWDGDALTFRNFQKRQYTKPSDSPEETRRRKAAERARKKGADIAPIIDMSRGVTPSHATDTDTDTDTEKDAPTEQAAGAAGPEESKTPPKKVNGEWQPKGAAQEMVVWWADYSKRGMPSMFAPAVGAASRLVKAGLTIEEAPALFDFCAEFMDGVTLQKMAGQYDAWRAAQVAPARPRSIARPAETPNGEPRTFNGSPLRKGDGGPTAAFFAWQASTMPDEDQEAS
jgi:hypothetical protein